jgi:hypothetical protein
LLARLSPKIIWHIPARQTRAILWPGASTVVPAGIVLPIAIWTQMSVSDAVSGLLASLLAIDLINSRAYSATAPAVLGTCHSGQL